MDNVRNVKAIENRCVLTKNTHRCQVGEAIKTDATGCSTEGGLKADRTAKGMARTEKRAHIDDLAIQAEDAAKRGEQQRHTHQRQAR